MLSLSVRPDQLQLHRSASATQTETGPWSHIRQETPRAARPMANVTLHWPLSKQCTEDRTGIRRYVNCSKTSMIKYILSVLLFKTCHSAHILSVHQLRNVGRHTVPLVGTSWTGSVRLPRTAPLTINVLLKERFLINISLGCDKFKPYLLTSWYFIHTKVQKQNTDYSTFGLWMFLLY